VHEVVAKPFKLVGDAAGLALRNCYEGLALLLCLVRQAVEEPLDLGELPRGFVEERSQLEEVRANKAGQVEPLVRRQLVVAFLGQTLVARQQIVERKQKHDDKSPDRLIRREGITNAKATPNGSFSGVSTISWMLRTEFRLLCGVVWRSLDPARL
jgi:hypothetical protein